DGVDNTRTKDAIGSKNQNLAFCDRCFRSSGHRKVSFQIELIKPSTESPWPSVEQIEIGLRTTRTQIQVVHGQGSADLLNIVVVLVYNPGRIPSPNGAPFQSAALASDAGEVDPP